MSGCGATTQTARQPASVYLSLKLTPQNPTTLEVSDPDALNDALNVLEHRGLAVQITNLIGKLIEYAVSALPDTVSRRIGDATRSALRSSLRVAASTMYSERSSTPSNTIHRAFL